MKKILYTLIALATLAFANSCKPETLETTPTDAVSGEFILGTTEGGYQALNGTIRFFWQWGSTTTGNYHQCFGPLSYGLAADLMGEDFIMHASGNGWFWYDYLYDVKDMFNSTTWRPYDAWNYYYTLISNCNYILAKQDEMQGPEEDVNYIMGNAYAFRAYAYAFCAMLYARSYIGHEDRLCIPIYTEPTQAGTPGKARSTNKEVFAQAMSDINNAIELIGSASRRHVSQFDKYNANGVKARIALYMGDYQTAYDAAKIAAEGGSYEFDPDEHFNDAFADDVIWGAEIIESQGTTNPQFLAHMDYRFGGYGDAARKCCSNWLYGKMAGQDLRKGWWKMETMPDGTQKLQQYKFLFQDPTNTYIGADHVFMRVPEMILTMAECACRLGRDSEAQEILNDFMSTRCEDYECTKTGTALGKLTTDETGSLLEEILIQRRVELWGEYGRVYDIKRLRQGFVRTEAMGHPKAALLNTLHCDDPESFDWVLTIPAKEYDANPLMVKNPITSYAEGEYGDDPALTPASEE